jgi:hypothetical protein
METQLLIFCVPALLTPIFHIPQSCFSLFFWSKILCFRFKEVGNSRHHFHDLVEATQNDKF